MVLENPHQKPSLLLHMREDGSDILVQLLDMSPCWECAPFKFSYISTCRLLKMQRLSAAGKHRRDVVLVATKHQHYSCFPDEILTEHLVAHSFYSM